MQPAPSIVLTPEELHALTQFARAADQLAELKRRGFYRAYIGRAGKVILERAHYEAVCRGLAANDDSSGPRPKVRPPRRRA